ncbi:MAG: hypothetical protein GQ535_11105 [Rhodobacteraceae bacterium]|nr:hypothetical protein [Paracoccaceae bacterium]
MGSKADKAIQADTNNVAVDRSVTTGTGTSIMDSIVIDPSDEVMIASLEQMRASFEVLMSGTRTNLEEVLGLGTDVMQLVDDQSIRMDDWAYEQLRTSMEYLEAEREEGKFIIDLTDDLAERSYNLAGDAVEGSQDATLRALDLVAEVKTGNSKDTIQTVTIAFTLMALGAIWLATKD